MTESTTTETDLYGMQWSDLAPGDHVDAIRKGTVVRHGILEESVPHLGVVWIRETGTGERRMLVVGDVGLRRRWAAPGTIRSCPSRGRCGRSSGTPVAGPPAAATAKGHSGHDELR